HSSRAFWRRTSTRAAACVWCCATRATTPAGDRGGRPRSSSCGSLRGGVTGLDSRGMTLTTPPADLLDNLVRALEPIFRLDDLVALSSERALYRAWDRLLKRPIALRAHLVPDGPGRAWFLRENETLAALDHPAIRHVYAAGVACEGRADGGGDLLRRRHGTGARPRSRDVRPGAARTARRPRGTGPRAAARPPGPAGGPLFHGDRDARGFRERRRRLP